ncbi:intermembrane transport protein PqiB [Uliginosibacterium gangwonense]|uniref:PqiB family protein n=1 Tax=Uliginosibacterium gangwonense TaxID=392736 RepID=UPI0003642569|nr:MlaD family protein [Uliginosibacterium gangwonense]
MVDQTEPPVQDFPHAISQRPSLLQRLPVVWLVPLIALLVGGWLAIKAIRDQGPTITISFESAAGLEAGKTKLKYKELDIGMVKSVTLAADRSHVIVKAEMSPSVADLMLEDTRFWVVRPRIANGGISGLDTVLSGAYIGMDVGDSAQHRQDFVGLEAPPMVTAHQAGRLFRLKASDLGSLSYGTPVYFRRIEVGELVAYELDRDGSGITAKVFIHAPYDKYVTRETHFWHASGLDVSMDATGVRLRTQSLASVVLGGIAFSTQDDTIGKEPAAAETSFVLAESREDAFRPDDSVFDEYDMVFNETVRGLKPGAEVDFRGIAIGEVVSLGMSYERDKRSLTVPVRIRIYPDRMRSLNIEQKVGDTPAGRRKLLDDFIAAGLRAQLRTGNLLTGQLYVALDFFPKAARQAVDWARVPPVLPTTNGDLHELQATLASIAGKLDRIPFEQISADLHQSLQSLDKALKDADALIAKLDGEVAPEIKATLASARQTLNTTEQTMANQSPMQQELQGSLREVSRAAQSVRELTDYLQRHPEALLRGKTEEK